MQKDCYRTYYRPLIDRKIGWREPVSIIKLGIVKRSTMPRKSSAKSAPGECGKEAGESMPDALGFQGGGVRAAILTLIKNYENIMKNILEAVTEAIVIKLMNNPKFTDTLAKNVLDNITSTHSSTQFLLSQINPICTINFFLGTLYVCNGGWILTVVRAHK